MKVIVCIDENYGMLFNKRRVSKDIKIIEDIESSIDVINMLNFSSKLFNKKNIVENLVDGYNFVETSSLKDMELYIEEIIVYNFNRKYPSTLKVELDFTKYNAISTNEFVGSSHDKITKTVYRRNI